MGTVALVDLNTAVAVSGYLKKFSMPTRFCIRILSQISYGIQPAEQICRHGLFFCESGRLSADFRLRPIPPK